VAKTLFNDRTDARDFRSDIRGLRDTIDPPPVEAEKGTLLAQLADGTKIFAPSKNQDRAPQVLNYPTLEDYTSECWNEFIVDFRRIDIKARAENKVPLSQCICPDIIRDLCNDAKLEFSKFHGYSNDELIKAIFKYNGPKNGTQAKNELKKWLFKIGTQIF
jgi:hypothetical protein